MPFSYRGYNVNIASDTQYEAYAALSRSGFFQESPSKAEVKKRLLSVSNTLPIGAEVKIGKVYHPKRGYEPDAKFRSGESAEEETLRLVEHGSFYDPATGKPKEAKWIRVSRYHREAGGRTPWVAFEGATKSYETKEEPMRRRPRGGTVRAALPEEVGWGMHIGWIGAYVYAADLYCEDCGRAIQDEIHDEIATKGSTDDSEDYPQGPYPDGGGEADGPAHCGSNEGCLNAMTIEDQRIGVWLGNPLTAEGVTYLLEMINAPNPSPYQRALHDFWRRVYSDYLPKEEEEELPEPPPSVSERRGSERVPSFKRVGARVRYIYTDGPVPPGTPGTILGFLPRSYQAQIRWDNEVVSNHTPDEYDVISTRGKLNEAAVGQGMTATAFVELLRSLVPADRMTRVDFQKSLGGERGGGSVYVNFTNLPPGAGRGGGGAEAENNRASFWIRGFQYDPAAPVGKVTVEQSSNVFHRAWLGAPGVPFRAKTGSPETIARYLAAYLAKIVATVPPRFTHATEAGEARRRPHQMRLNAALYRLRGVEGADETITYAEFAAANDDMDPRELHAILTLRPGETYRGGGGAAPEWSITRLSEHELDETRREQPYRRKLPGMKKLPAANRRSR